MFTKVYDSVRLRTGNLQDLAHAPEFSPLSILSSARNDRAHEQRSSLLNSKTKAMNESGNPFMAFLMIVICLSDRNGESCIGPFADYVDTPRCLCQANRKLFNWIGI